MAQISQMIHLGFSVYPVEFFGDNSKAKFAKDLPLCDLYHQLAIAKQDILNQN